MPEHLKQVITAEYKCRKIPLLECWSRSVQFHSCATCSPHTLSISPRERSLYGQFCNPEDPKGIILCSMPSLDFLSLWLLLLGTIDTLFVQLSVWVWICVFSFCVAAGPIEHFKRMLSPAYHYLYGFHVHDVTFHITVGGASGYSSASKFGCNWHYSTTQ